MRPLAINKKPSFAADVFLTEWKLGNTPNEKPRDPAFGGVFFLSDDSVMSLG